jgi:hypothetical protein
MKRMPRRTTVVLLMIVVGAIGGCARSSHSIHAAAKFTINGERFVGGQFVGFGVQLSPLMYCAPNWGDAVTPENVGIFERKLELLGPQHVRIFVEREWWEAGGDQARKESFFKILQLTQRIGATVNMTLWHGPYPDIEKAAKSFCAAVVETVRDRGYSNVQYVTLQNEVNLTKMKPENYDRLYRAFDKELRRVGLRDRIKIIGGDLTGERQLKWFTNLSEELPDVLDGYSVHMYNDYLDGAHLLKRAAEVPVIVNGLPENARKPIYLMEYGTWSQHRENVGMSGYTPAGVAIYDTNIAGVQNAWWLIETIKRGYVAMVAWEACDIAYGKGHEAHDRSKFGMMAGGNELFRIRPVYYMLWVFTHTAFPRWQAVEVKGQSDTTALAAMRGPGGEWTIYALDHAKTADSIEIDGVPARMQFHLTRWNAAGDGQISQGGTITSDRNGRLQLELNGESLVALTSP